jgi:hypothetical protein
LRLFVASASRASAASTRDSASRSMAATFSASGMLARTPVIWAAITFRRSRTSACAARSFS